MINIEDVKQADTKKANTTENIENIITGLMSKEYRKDAEFRFAILATEIGDIGKYITHDQVLNPSARPHGSESDEKLAYGQVIVQLMALAHIRGINYNEAFKAGLDNWLDYDWKKHDKKLVKKGALAEGIAANGGMAYGKAYVLDSKRSLREFAELKERRILVMKYAKPDFAVALDYVAGVVTNHGGYTCHAANICRDNAIPCLVATNDATEKIEHDSNIYMASGFDGNPGLGFVALDEVK